VKDGGAVAFNGGYGSLKMMDFGFPPWSANHNQ
jgi:hypothetical protein